MATRKGNSVFRISHLIKGLICQIVFIIVILACSYFYKPIRFLIVISVLNIFKLLKPVITSQINLARKSLKKSVKVQKNIKRNNNLQISSNLAEKKNIYFTENNKIYQDSVEGFKILTKKRTPKRKEYKRDINSLIKINNRNMLFENFKRFLIKDIIKPLVKKEAKYFRINSKISESEAIKYFESRFLINRNIYSILLSISRIGWVYYEDSSSEHKQAVNVLLESYISIITNNDQKYKDMIFINDLTSDFSFKINNCCYECEGDPLVAYFYLFLYIKKESGGFLNEFDVKRMFII